MELLKKLPVGIEFFGDMQKEDFYYIDKTSFIKELLDNWAKVNLFTRPRRFGKTLNMDMLKTFFETGTDPSLFDNLAISKETALCQQYMGQFPVIFLSLKSVAGNTYNMAYDMFCEIITHEARRFWWLMDSKKLAKYDKIPLAKMLENDYSRPATLFSSIKVLSDLLYKHYGQKTIILIDEYDVPLEKAYQNNYYNEMAVLIRTIFEMALKTNNSLYFAAITGCLRISKESIFTGLNNFNVHTISDSIYDEYFGFTDNEVKKLLSDYGMSEKYNEIKEWYDGYRFGQENLYCPWDVINYVKDHM